MRGVVFLLFGLYATSVCAQQSFPLPDTLTYRELQITDEHRFDSAAPGMMSGHWGHHLGHLVRTRTNGLWFVDDTGRDVYETPTARYYHLAADGAWTLQAQIANRGKVQQNTASVAVEDTIYTYGINIEGPSLVENRLDTGTLAGSSRRVMGIEPNTNYIGAAVSPRGVRVVWWSNVVDGGGPSTWFYTYNDGDGWSPIISSPIPGHNDFSYVLLTFVDDSTFWAAGEAIGGFLPDWTYELGVGKVVIGRQLTDFSTLPGSNYTSCDIWHNPVNGDVHLLGNGQGGNVTYYRKPHDGPWPDSARILTNPQTVWRGTRFIDAPDGKLYVVLSTPNGLKLKFVDKADITGSLELDTLRMYDIANNDGFNRIFAVFPECAQFQTAPVGGVNFAHPGNDYDYSALIMHGTIGRPTPVGVADAPRPSGLSLELNVPNPFNPMTRIGFVLPQPGRVRVHVYSTSGQLVRTLVDSTLNAGAHSVVWDASDSAGRPVASGVYLCRLVAEHGVRVRRMTVAR